MTMELLEPAAWLCMIVGVVVIAWIVDVLTE